MLKVGLPKAAIKMKMGNENVNPNYIDMDPMELVPLEDNFKASKSSPIKKAPKVISVRLRFTNILIFGNSCAGPKEETALESSRCESG